MNINLKMKLNKIFCNSNTNNIIINNSYLFEKEKKFENIIIQILIILLPVVNKMKLLITFIFEIKGKIKGKNKKWQSKINLMYKKTKFYVESYSSEEFAVRIYIILSLKLRGIKTRNNFIKIPLIDFDIKTKNINGIIDKFVQELHIIRYLLLLFVSIVIILTK